MIRLKTVSFSSLLIFISFSSFAQVSDSCSYIFNGKILNAYTFSPFVDVSQMSVYVTDYHCNINSENRVTPIAPDGSVSVDTKTYYWSLKFFRDIPSTSNISSFVNNDDLEYLKKVVADDPQIVSNPPSIIQMLAMDLNQDGTIDGDDVRLMKQLLKGQIKEFKLANNYFGYPLYKYSDWLFLNQALLQTQWFTISSTFPNNDGLGYSRHFVPSWEAGICMKMPITGDRTCPTIGDATYIGFVLGDVNGNVITSGARMRPASETVFEESLSEINIFPNPATHEVHIVVPNNAMTGSLQIFDLQGRLMLQKEIKHLALVNRRLKIDTSEFPDGMYLIRLVSNNQILKTKFVKN
jgi:hypothetical protein